MMDKKNSIEEKTALLLEGVGHIAAIDERRFEELAEVISFKKPEERERNLARGFLRVARDDIRAARVLYECGLYSLSVYHMQQAVEKEVKAYLLILGKLNFEDLCTKRGKGKIHSTTRIIVKIFKEVMEELDKVHKDTTGNSLIPKEDKNKFDEAFKVINELSAGNRIIDLDENFKNFLQESITTIELSQDLETIKRLVEEAFQKLYDEEIPEEFRLAMVEEEERLIRKMSRLPKMISLFVGLYMLSALTLPHAQFTRYPLCYEKVVPQPWEYDPEKFKFIRSERFILDVTEQYLNAIEDLIKDTEEEEEL